MEVFFLILFPVKLHLREDVYLQWNVLPKGDVSRHCEVVELQHVGDALEADQVLLNLETDGRQRKILRNTKNPKDPNYFSNTN